MHPSRDDLQQLRGLATELNDRTENEAETRHKIIDLVLHSILAWPRNRVKVEEHIKPGFADYVLKKADSHNLIFIEAKRSGIFFSLPYAHKPDEISCYISIEKLLSDNNIRGAMTQVRTYCIDTGCEFACVTNGHEWIFFKTFEKGKRWESLQAFVLRSLDFFEKEYTQAVNCLSYLSITEKSSLTTLLTSAPPKDRNIYYAKERIPSYSHSINANRLAPMLRPVVNRYFGVIGDDDTEFMDRCYVSERDYHHTFDGMRTLIHDSLCPYFAFYNVQQLEDTGKGGRLGGRLTKNIKMDRKGEVLVLFGGKGAGKSTFIKRLLHHNPPRWLRDHSIIAIIDLLKTPEDSGVIRAAIWDRLVEEIDREGLLSADRDDIIEKLFVDRFAVAARQELSGLSPVSEAYNTRLNALVSDWKRDKTYCAKRLVTYWKNREKGIIVVVDNTDQFSGLNQDFCFTSAQEIADELGCVTLIPTREERLYNSKIHGVLDAFQNAGFHISSPKPAEVFRKRLDYTMSLLQDRNRRGSLVSGLDSLIDDCCKYLGIIELEFRNDRSPLNSFLSACAHGDTRLSLDLFRSFLLSGYTNVEEMLSAGRWNFQIHQVIKPVMIPNRYFYDEMLSDIPNIYQLRYNRQASHFTGLRILRKLAKSVDGSAAAYVSMAELRTLRHPLIFYLRAGCEPRYAPPSPAQPRQRR
jgi:GTPase SAR1 family protein